ncbi:ABC transporter ATP-binding protein [Candidatus Poribacteria bacterium]
MDPLTSEEVLLKEPKDELPESIQEEFDSISEPQEDIRVAVTSDMNLDGEFEDTYLLATDKRILVFSGNHVKGPELVHEVSLADINQIKLKNYVGNGILEVETDDKSIELLRFSKTAFHKNDIGGIPKAIDRLREQSGQDVEKRKEHGEEPHHEGGRGHRCEKCGNTIPHWTDTCPQCLEKRALLLRLLGYLKPYWYIAVIAFSLSVITVALGQLIPPLITKELMDKVFKPIDPNITDPQRFSMLNMLVLALIGIHVVNTGLGTIRTYMMSWLGNKVILSLRTSAYEYLQRLSLTFYNKKETGRLMSRISYDTGHLQGFIVGGIQEFVMNILVIIGMSVILFMTNWRLAALTLIPIPVITVGSIIFGKKMHIVYHKVYRRAAGMSAILADTIPGVRVVKAFVAEKREADRYREKNEEYFTSSMRAAKLSTIYFPIMGFATFAGGIIVRWFGGRDVVGGGMTLGELMLFMSYMYMFYGPIQSLTRLNNMLQRAASAAERVFEILDAQPDVDDKKNAVELPTIQGDIKFDNVVFSYDEEKNALDGVSFEIKAGQMIGLSGPSGAGKTTLINLIGRFYDVTEGSISIDGHDIRDVKMRSLRDQVGIVLQSPFLFHGTVAENISYSKPDASRAEIVAAAKAANAHDFIMGFPDGYDTMVGERGTGLSGGEQQRISIARAILKNPRILILDEATSSVDTETESLIQAAIERLVEGRTTFAIAHRLSTLRKADKLIILEKGEVAEMGTHDELIKNNGLYKRLVDLQSELSSMKAV